MPNPRRNPSAPISPVLIGWSRVTRYDGEPLAAWAEALTATGVPPGAIESLDVLYCQSWQYDDPAGRLAELVGAKPRRTNNAGIGGTRPLLLLEDAAERIMRGDAEVCAIVGGEALATVRALRKRGEKPPWSHPVPRPRPFPYEGSFHPSEVAHQVFQAYSTFALRDVSRRAHRREDVGEHQAGIGRLFAPMTKVAARNPHAWFPAARSADELMTVTTGNRMVAFPYPKLVTAMMDVDQAAAVVVASPHAAARLGVPPDRRVWLRGWAADRDPDHVAEHADLWQSPAMATALNGALRRASVEVDEIAHFDLYSCFPSSVAFALDALGLDADDTRGPFTVTGGLPYAGGPGSAYAITSLAAMADTLVEDPGSLGMLTAVGMHMSRHAAVVLSTWSGALGARPERPARTRRPIVPEPQGDAVVAAYTVHHRQDGTATDALLICDVDGREDGGRCYATATDADLLAALETDEWVGRRVRLHHADGINLATA